jgi:hypothetical protein
VIVSGIATVLSSGVLTPAAVALYKGIEAGAQIHKASH